MIIPFFLTCCAMLPRPSSTPVRAKVKEPMFSKVDELVVLLPGRYSLPSEFEREGFVDLVKKAHPNARIVVPDLHIGYYKKQQATKRLHEDIILPARKQGITDVTLVGISMGGLGAVTYALEYPETKADLILLSPFIGDESVIADIKGQGGLDQWKPVGEEPDRFSRRLWLELRDQWKNGRPNVRLGCGKSDRLAPASKLMAEEFLSNDDMLWLEGDHDWKTWNALYEELE